nr:DcaP family trimeric outer membrane transporter [Polymorphobacter sp.]
MMSQGVMLGAASALLALASGAGAAEAPDFELYGTIQLDYIQNFRRADPDWTSALRPSRIPTTKGQFGPDGEADLSVKQSKFGVKADIPAGAHDLTTQFEFDMFGVGDNAGQTTFRLRHAWASWGPLLIGQTNTLFMDGDLFPNVVDYWGPTGMVFLRNPQVRLTVVDKAGFKFAFAIEKANTDVDVGDIREIDPDLGANIQDATPLPDLTLQARYAGDWGHVQLSALLSKLAYETIGTPDNQPRGSQFGWGLNLGTSFNVAPATTLRAGVVYGHGIASYMNDGGTDLAPRVTNAAPGLEAQAVPLLGIIAYVDHRWSKSFTSALGYSLTKVENTDFQSASAYHKGEYASGNLLWEPVPHILVGGELMYGKRTDNDGASGDDIRTQLTFKASFSSKDLLKRK